MLSSVTTMEPQLAGTAEQAARAIPGFLGATVLRGLDGTRVVNYAQWVDRAAFEAFIASPGAQQRMPLAMALGTPDAHLYEIFATVPGTSQAERADRRPER